MTFEKFHFHTEVFIDFVENVDVIRLCSEEDDFYHADKWIKKISYDMNHNIRLALSVYFGKNFPLPVSDAVGPVVRTLFGDQKGCTVTH